MSYVKLSSLELLNQVCTSQEKKKKKKSWQAQNLLFKFEMKILIKISPMGIKLYRVKRSVTRPAGKCQSKWLPHDVQIDLRLPGSDRPPTVPTSSSYTEIVRHLEVGRRNGGSCPLPRPYTPTQVPLLLLPSSHPRLHPVLLQASQLFHQLLLQYCLVWRW